MINVMTREYLATYIYLESEINRLRRRLDYYEKNPLGMDYGVVKGSMKQFPFAECHFIVSGPRPKSNEERERQIRQLVIDIKGNEMLYEQIKLDIECFIESLPIEEAEIRQILSKKYIDGMNDGEIAEELMCDRRTVGKKIDRFLSTLK